jgi:hypothetical protein
LLKVTAAVHTMFNDRVRDIVVGNILSFSVGILLLSFLELRVERSLIRTTYTVALRAARH